MVPFLPYMSMRCGHFRFYTATTPILTQWEEEEEEVEEE
jgi:hypothetical protein